MVSSTVARNMQSRIGGFSQIQLVFGRDTSCPDNLMEALAGQLKYTMTKPDTVDEAMRRAQDIWKAAQPAFQWMESSEALRRAAGSKARIPRLQMLAEGMHVRASPLTVEARRGGSRTTSHGTVQQLSQLWRGVTAPSKGSGSCSGTS